MGVSSMKLHCDIGVTQRTARFVLHHLRKASEREGPPDTPYEGPVEMDEVYIGKHRDKRLEAGRGAVGKQACMGAKDRASNRIAARPVDLPTQDEVTKPWSESTDCDAKVYTDGSLIYAPVPNHSKVNHSNGEYGRRDLHFNGIESFWSLFK